MSENAEGLRDWLEVALLHGDIADLGDLSLFADDVRYEDEILPDHVGETYHGHDGFRRAWARALEPWDVLEVRVEWLREGDDVVVSCHWGRLRGKESGVEAEIRYAYVWRFDHGKVVQCKSYADPDTALAVARLGP